VEGFSSIFSISLTATLAGLVAVDGVRHPVGDHGIQNLQLGGSILTGQEVAGVDDLAGGEFGFHQPADLVQFVHQADDDLSGGIALHDEVGAVTVLEAAREENISRKRCEDVDQPRTAKRDNLAQRLKHRFQQDGGSEYFSVVIFETLRFIYLQ
jgi:hypothetical protein